MWELHSLQLWECFLLVCVRESILLGDEGDVLQEELHGRVFSVINEKTEVQI